MDPRYHRTTSGMPLRGVQRAQVTGATFHDLRHTFVTNARRAGIDPLTVMKITGHKTMAVFKRYNTVDEGDLGRAGRRWTPIWTPACHDTAGMAVAVQNH